MDNAFLCNLAAKLISGDGNVVNAVDKAEAIVAEVAARYPDVPPAPIEHGKKAGVK